MKSILKSFARRTDGQVTVLFALACVPLLLGAGVAIDRIRLDNARTEMQAAVDGAALAAALADTVDERQRRKLANDYFQTNFVKGRNLEADFDIRQTARTLKVSARADYPTSFMRLAGIDATRLDAEAEVYMGMDGNAEVVMVLDYSGSMNTGNKVGRMAKAATDMVEELSRGAKPDQVKFGLVPFSAMVRTTMPASFVTQPSATSTWTGCTQDRAHPQNLTVDTPTSDSRTKWGHIDNSDQNRGGGSCSNYANRNVTILPLTSDTAAVKQQLKEMRPVGYTNIPLGTEFGWNLLDPQEPFTQGAPYEDKKTKKYLILLTDGVQTTPQWGTGGSRSVSNGNRNLPRLCGNIANKGIKIFAIAYDITDPNVTDLLKQCAGERYFEADSDGRDIARVFNSIAREIRKGSIRLAR